MEKVLYTNGRIYTLEERRRCAEAVLTEGGRILAAGERKTLEKEADEMYDLEGQTMLPAFLDSHGHILGVANGFLQVDLAEAVDFKDIRERIVRFLRENHVPQGKWVQAKGLDHSALAEKRMPPKEFLDGITSVHPLVVHHATGHCALLNSMGLARLEITDQTQSPAGGRIDFQRGLLEENALLARMDAFPMPEMGDLITAFEKAQRLYASYGLSTAQEGMFVEQIQGVYEMLLRQGKLWLDVAAYMDLRHSPWLLDAFSGCRGGYHCHFKAAGYKVILDGSPQSRTAWVTEPYDDGTAGYPAMTDDQLRELLCRAVAEGEQLLAHANGDAAADQFLRVYERVRREKGALVRPVLIHSQITRAEQLAKMAALGITPSFFPAHILHWGELHLTHLGWRRASRISAAHSALAAGLPFTLHQDAPVLPPNPLEAVGCAVERRTKEGRVLGGQERLTAWEALTAVTRQAAAQYGEDKEKGTISAGKRADFVVLEGDPMEMAPEEIGKTRVKGTILEGIVRYERK
ncbi:amidohydrolase [Anaerotignum lactatifermentans]|uniref:Amidohydrolase n=1 Tax=Anaerotignum lactatifermentans TaxID=160404 RepID=A0ABS2GB06_9FIRM|nr:amidohydrolase [Anaerotignum lactatifermentans]MBM6829439.1 amidohydrolase [Anaerotignum lactatifermentans]MBM6877797.1 amidohydrolase [Anaerotignum lactatifermentans]MBM6951016.1 amidohydrolase [Anaerotignum lactatifermentans]